MKPVAHLRHRSDPDALPAGWATQPAGTVAGLDMHVAYDPRRHDLLRALNAPNPTVRAGLVHQGWRQLAAGDDGVEVWVRDRNSAARAALQRLAAVLPDTLGITR